MMTPDFAYVMGGTPETDKKGEGVFQYWEEKGLWPELEGILSETFVKKDEYMVAPPQFANPALPYEGYRVGIKRVNGSWKFVYFVNGSRRLTRELLRLDQAAALLPAESEQGEQPGGVGGRLRDGRHGDDFEIAVPEIELGRAAVTGES